MDLKEEFANYLLSSHGFHLSFKTWEDAWAEAPGNWEEQIERARKWLILMDKTKKPNRRIGSSYGLKHRVERWHRKHCRNDPWDDTYVTNGCFLMAAIRLGFIFSPVPQVYCWKNGKGSYEQFNAFLNISSKSVKAVDNFKC